MPTLSKHGGQLMKGRKTWQLGYAAGVMDSDGCITIGRHHKVINGNHFSEYKLLVVVNQTDGRAIDFLYGSFGGNLYRRNGSKISGTERPFLYRWELSGPRASQFLKRIIPFLRIKKEQAELGVQFQSIRKYRPRNQHTGKNKIARYEELYQKMSFLKTRWLPSAAAETKWNGGQKTLPEAIVQSVENKN